MKCYWPLAPIPELVPLSENQRQGAWFAFYKKAICRWQTWLMAFIDLLFIGLVYTAIWEILTWYHITPIENRLALLVLPLVDFSIAVAVQVYVFLPILSEQMRPFLREYIKTITPR